MILELHDKNDGEPLLIDTAGMLCYKLAGETWIWIQSKEYTYKVKETIEEVKQQIKVGGICGHG